MFLLMTKKILSIDNDQELHLVSLFPVRRSNNKRIEDDQQQGKGKGKAKVIPQERRDFKSDRYSNNRPRRDYADQSGSNNT